MNRRNAKLVTVVGVFCCLLGVVFSIYRFAETKSLDVLPLSLLVSGIVLVTLSLAYYTEK